VGSSPEEPLSVSVNGLDNIGKTTQLGWLHRGVPGAHLAGTIDAWDARWQELAAGDFAHWWFAGSATAEHAALVLGSHAARRAGSGPLALEDRGLPMLRAVCAATAALKEGVPPADALRLVDRVTAGSPVAFPRRELHLLLRHSADPVQEADEALRREPATPGARYAAYLHALAEIMFAQAAAGEYDIVLDIGDDPVLDVQRRIRACLTEHGIGVEPLPVETPTRLWMLAGMSESGKSTVGELLRDEYGATRLKIGYLLEVAALRAGITDPYLAWSEREQSERLTEELLRFCGAVKASTVSVESAHRFEATAHLKRVWGDRCQVVYVDAPLAVRASRTAESPESMRQRDEIKHQRGAHRIAGIADHVITNEGPLSTLKAAVAHLVPGTDLPRAVPVPAPPQTHGPWLRQAAARLTDEETALVLATGSTGTARWRAGWSDLDLLVVRDSAPLAWLRRAPGTLTGPDGIKTAVSVFTTADITALRVPPRVVQSLRHAASGTGTLYQRPGYLLPAPAHAHSDRASRGELGLVLMTTRRLLAAGPTDIRAVHKHLVLIAKIMLRADSRDLDDPDDVLAAFSARHPQAGCAVPRLTEITASPRGDQEMEHKLLGAADSVLAYLDQLGTTGRTLA
jgi:adenylylsulfate kinase-like enzyme